MRKRVEGREGPPARLWIHHSLQTVVRRLYYIRTLTPEDNCFYMRKNTGIKYPRSPQLTFQVLRVTGSLSLNTARSRDASLTFQVQMTLVAAVEFWYLALRYWNLVSAFWRPVFLPRVHFVWGEGGFVEGEFDDGLE